MLDDSRHAACVDAWLERTAKDLPSEPLLRLYEAAFQALWTLTQTTLGEVTLAAIAERVLFNAAEKLPILASLKIDSTTGLDCRDLRARLGAAADLQETLREGLRFVLIELLTVLGNLTAEILTPELHAELSRVALPETARAAGETQRNAIDSQGTAGEDTRSS